MLSDIKGKRSLDVFAAVIDPLCNISEDDAMREIYLQKNRPESRTPKAYMLTMFAALIERHRDDFVAIMAACRGCSEAAYTKELTPAALLTDCAELIGDDIFKMVFSVAQGKRSGESSDSAQENIEEV